VRDSGLDPYDVPIPDLAPPMSGATPAVQDAVAAALRAPRRAIDERIAQLRLARAAWTRTHRATLGPAAVVIAQALAGELHRRGGVEDIEEAIQTLLSAVPASAACFDPTSAQHLHLVNDLAVLYLDRAMGDLVDNRLTGKVLLQAVERLAAAGGAATRLLLVDVWLNLGVGAIENRDGRDRSDAQEEGIAWLEQALGVGDLPTPTEAMLCSNLGAAYRSRVAGNREDNLARAQRHHERGLALARETHASEADERLIAALAMAATSASDIGNYDAATESFRESIALAAGSLPDGHPTLLRARANLGSTLHSRFLARRASDAVAARVDIDEARVVLSRTCAAMATSLPPHPMLQAVRANLAAVCAEHVGDRRLDRTAAVALFDMLLETTDPEVDPEILRSLGWNAGTFYLGEGDHGQAVRFFRVGFEASRRLADRSLLFASKSNELRVLSNHAHRFALSVCVAGRDTQLAEAFDALDQSRVRLIGGIYERARMAVDDSAPGEPGAVRAVLEARAALDRQLSDERRLATATPDQRRTMARQVRQGVENALALIDPLLRDANPAHGVIGAPVVHVATCSLGTAVLIRFPDGEMAGFTGNVRDEHVAPLLGAASSPWGRGPRLRAALDALMPLIGTQIAEPLAAHLLGRGWREAVVVPGGAAAMLPLPAAPLRGFGADHHGQLIDAVSLRTAPAQRLLRPSRARSEAPFPFLAVIDNSLRAGRWELAGPTPFLRRAIEDGNVLSGAGGDVLDRLQTAGWLHLAAHGRQDPGDPMLGLVDLPGVQLHVFDLLTEHRFRPGCTVVAPACRAAWVHFANLDESLSVAHAMLAGGAETVVAGLWDIPDLATALLIARCYALLDEHSLWAQPEVALRSAQRWLRDATWSELGREASEAVHGRSAWLAPGLASELLAAPAADGDDRPFAHPASWAGLTTVSARSS
jgi:tetratricopeptide (TPR) repeat protein